MNLKLHLVSSLVKVFPDEEPRAFDGRVEGFLNENVSFQAAWIEQDPAFTKCIARIRVESPIAAYVRVRRVRYVPVLFPTFADADDNYLRKTPGLYPDPLTDELDNITNIFSNHWEAAWFDIDCGEEIPSGVYPIDVILEDFYSGAEIARIRAEYTRLNARLPEQKLIHTKWFHTDGLARWYRTEMFSEDFWEIVKNYIRAFRKRSMNMLLTPIHTPPLDTKVGGERTTCQLVDVEVVEEGVYKFGFEKFERWINTALELGIEYFEMAHLFTQWGAKCAPKIMAKVNGEEKQIFGWDNGATSEEYLGFLDQYLPAIVKKIDEMGIRERCIFHISDEPNKSFVDNYMVARKAVSKHLEGFAIVDALSDIELYKSGAVQTPIPGNNHIKPFIEAGVPNLWTYYCVSQYKDVSNTFVAMPSQRTRIIGVQMFKYDIVGFLQWGFNHYNSQLSMYPINPYLSTDADGFSPAGDCFQVYPGEGGQPIESIRMLTMAEAMQDLRAMNLLSSLKGKDFVMNLIEDGIEPIEFDRYPKDAKYLLNLRKRINLEIMKAIG